MTVSRVIIDGDNVIMSRDEYFNLWELFANMLQFSEYLEGVGDDAFQAQVWQAFCDYFIRIFPDYRCEEQHDE